MTAALSREFELVCACCRWPRDAAADARVRALAAEAPDWHRVVAIAERQRVQGLVAHGLRSAGVMPPAPAGERIEAAARRIVLANLALTRDMAQFRAGLDAAGIDALFVKGVPLAMQVYATLAVKMSLDIDVLVALDSIDAACAVLETLGYRRTVPDAAIAPHQVKAWVEQFKETSWVHPERGTIIDLHARLVTNPTLIPGVGLASPRREVVIVPGISVPTLGDEAQFAYLCAHGAESGWSRLKWIVDLAALAGGRTPDEIERLYRFAEREGAGRCAAQGLLLCARLLGTELGTTLAAELRRPMVNRLLEAMALSSITGRYESEPHRFDSWGGIPILASHFLIARGLRHKLAELGGKLGNPRDRALGRLPKPLGFLYPALGVGRLAGRWLGGGRRTDG